MTVPPIGAAPEAAELPEVGTVRSWRDRINTVHQGRVTAVDAARREVSFTTAHGATATVPASSVVPASEEPGAAEAAAARLAAVAHAQRWLDVTLPQRLEDCVTGAWDALTALECGDRDSDAVKVAAAERVVQAAGDLADRVRAHVQTKQEGTG